MDGTFKYVKAPTDQMARKSGASFSQVQTHPDAVFWCGYPNDMAMMMSFFTGEG
jgi:hypothetical protein